MIGEIYLPLERLVAYYGTNLDGVHLPFNFQLLQTTWNARGLATLIDQYEEMLPKGGWPNWVLGNHDNRRIATRVGVEQAKVAAMLLLTLRGTPTMYYGDELGMEDVEMDRKSTRLNSSHSQISYAVFCLKKKKKKKKNKENLKKKHRSPVK